MAKKSIAIPKFPEFVDILGTPWKIVVKTKDEYPDFEKCNADGFCSNPEKTILILDIRSVKNCENETQEYCQEYMKETLRHEIVHAFFYESGLSSSAMSPKVPWPKNEELVDWIAHQGQKIFKAWEQTGCLKIMPPERWVELKKEGYLK